MIPLRHTDDSEIETFFPSNSKLGKLTFNIKSKIRPGAMAHQVRAQALLPEDPESNTLSWSPKAPGIHTVHKHTDRQNIHTQNKSAFFFKKKNNHYNVFLGTRSKIVFCLIPPTYIHTNTHVHINTYMHAHRETNTHIYICTYIQREIHTHAHIHTERNTHLHIYINTHATNTLIKINAMGPKQKKNMKVKVRPVGK